MRVVCSCNPLLGHLHPMLPLAGALRDAGHDVAFLTGSEIGGTIAAAGFEVLAAGPEFSTLVGEGLTRYPDTPLATSDDQQRFGFERLFSELRVEATLPAAENVVDAFRPDLVVNEVADFVGPLLAARRGVPNATAGVGLVLRPEWLTLAARGVARFWTASGVDAPADAGLYRCLYLNQLPRSFQRSEVEALPSVHDLRPVAFGDGAELPHDLEHVGRDRPLVYVTFGTLFSDPAVVQTVIDGVRTLDIDVVVTLGPDGDPDLLERSGDHLYVRRFVPQGALLERCALVVTHGGVGSVVGPLSHAVPLIVIPMGADQQENADQVAASGAGRVIEPAALTPDAVLTAAVEVFGDNEISRATARLRDEIAAMPSPSDVVGVLESLAEFS